MWGYGSVQLWKPNHFRQAVSQPEAYISNAFTLLSDKVRWQCSPTPQYVRALYHLSVIECYVSSAHLWTLHITTSEDSAIDIFGHFSMLFHFCTKRTIRAWHSSQIFHWSQIIGCHQNAIDDCLIHFPDPAVISGVLIQEIALWRIIWRLLWWNNSHNHYCWCANSRRCSNRKWHSIWEVMKDKCHCKGME